MCLRTWTSETPAALHCVYSSTSLELTRSTEPDAVPSPGVLFGKTVPHSSGSLAHRGPCFSH